LTLELKGRQLVPGRALGEAVFTEALSFYGDVDPNTGLLRDGRSVAGKVVVALRPRGSTVGSYVIYALRANGLAPAPIVMSRVDPIIVAGCVLASIPLGLGGARGWAEVSEGRGPGRGAGRRQGCSSWPQVLRLVRLRHPPQKVLIYFLIPLEASHVNPRAVVDVRLDLLASPYHGWHEVPHYIEGRPELPLELL